MLRVIQTFITDNKVDIKEHLSRSGFVILYLLSSGVGALWVAMCAHNLRKYQLLMASAVLCF